MNKPDIAPNINIKLQNIEAFQKVALSVDCVVFGYDEESKDLKILLLKSEMPQFEGMYSLLGDLVKPDETLEDAAQRIIKERAGFDGIYLEQVHAFSDVSRHPLGRVVSVAFYTLVKTTDYTLPLDTLDLEASWHSTNELKTLAFDHNKIFDTCLRQLKKRIRIEPIGFSLLPKKFTLKEIQNLYETILETSFEKRNFRRKLRNLDLLIALDEIQKDVAHRPAKLYAFNFEAYHKKRLKGVNFSL